ncbi:MAG: hypothetical protein A2992_00390 [Elusimicrobia bacterium RIFCSPLOWO2_01_FULL_59_12]|nr:MAG: hypothetical protein A2992_00390 [Elusimicrobia bacterium RIFCSPLOWO2_01_FULL_59_12]
MRRRPALGAAVCLFLTPGLSGASDPLERSAFSQIEFSNNCAKKQWLLSPDNTLQLQIAPPRKGTCVASLYFHFPQEAASIETLRFEARGLKPGSFLRIGLADAGDARAHFSRTFPEGGLGSTWTQSRVPIRQLRDAWNPSRIAALHFVAVSNRSLSSQPTVMIRHIRLAAASSAATGSAQPARVSPDTSAGSPTSIPSASSASSSKAPKAGASHPPLFPTTKILLSLAGGVLLVLAMGSRTRRRRILSPLYEINMRTWRTRRDENDVLRFGGFKKVAPADLRAIKQAGFNTLWLMGIWEIGAKVRQISKNYAADFHGSPFAIFDYRVSTDLGSEDDFRDLVRRAHNLRMSVIVDFIPNHMGLDSAWLNDHPEYFIHRILDASECDLADEDLKQRYPGFFPYRTPSYPQGDRRLPKTIMVAYGKDPYFYPWIDTAQLDYANPGLRRKMIDVLCYWAKIVDGVRCDMAMLALRDQVKIHRHPDMTWDTFNETMPNEFWSEAIPAVKRVNPNFVFLAETYWSMEGYLQNLGFDYTYNKPLYEALCNAVHSGHAEGLMNFLRLLGTDFLKRSVHFLENHDEERAMNALGEERQRAAAAILCTLPGIALLHQGQMEGQRERLPVQRVVPLHQEPVHSSLHHFYRKLLKATSLPVFQEGRLTPLYSNNPALVSYARLDNDTKVLVIVNTSQKNQKGSVFLMPGLRVHSGASYRLNDLFYSFKANTAGTVQPFYVYPGARLINQGLYVELEPFDAHIFVVEPQGALQSTQKAMRAVRQTLDEWPLNRVARRVIGAAFSRSSDANLAANPTGRQS